MGQNLHPSVEKFKQFVKKHPKLVKEVRNGKKTWKELYEDWYLFGEEDEIWNQYKETQEETSTQSSSIVDKVVSTLKKMDMNDMQQHISAFQEAIAAIQNVIGQFQGLRKNQNNSSSSANTHPFSFRKD